MWNKLSSSLKSVKESVALKKKRKVIYLLSNLDNCHSVNLADNCARVLRILQRLSDILLIKVFWNFRLHLFENIQVII